MFQDRDGFLWFATDKEVIRYDGHTFTPLPLDERITSVTLRTMLGDSEGNLWLCTWGKGVARYDGKGWTIYDKTNALGDNYACCIFQDSGKNIWIGTRFSGVYKFDGKAWQNFFLDAWRPDPFILTVAEDSRHNIWVGTGWAGISRFDGKNWVSYKERDGFAAFDARSIVEDRQGNIWFATTTGGAIRYDGQKFRSFTPRDGLGHINVFKIMQDNAGRLWFGIPNGLSVYDGRHWCSYSKYNGLPSGLIASMLQDSEGNYWFGNDRGMCKLGSFAFESISPEGNGQWTVKVNQILEDSRHRYWFATQGQGVAQLDAGKWSYWQPGGKTGSWTCNGILQDRGGNVWIATRGAGVSRFGGSSWRTFLVEQGLSTDYVESCFEDRRGNLWFGHSEGLISVYDGKRFRTLVPGNQPQDNAIISIFQDSGQDMWFGTSGAGALRYDGQHWQEYGIGKGLPGNTVSAIVQDRAGNYWFATENGLCRFDGQSFRTFTTADGLSGNDCYALLYREGCLYIGTGNGLNRYDGNKFKIYTTRDGLLSNVLSRPSLSQDSQGNIWIGSNSGVTRFNPALEKTNRIPPPVYLTGFKVNDRDTTVVERCKLNSHENYLTFEYTGVCFSNPDALVFQYTLEGLDSGWRTTRQRSIQYSALPPGNYTFRVKALNGDGIWSRKPAEMAITITPPFWATWWFRTTGLLFLAGLVFYRIYELKKRNLLLSRKAQELEMEVRERRLVERELESEQKQLETMLGHKTLLAEVASKLNTDQPFDNCVPSILRQLAGIVCADGVALYRLGSGSVQLYRVGAAFETPDGNGILAAGTLACASALELIEAVGKGEDYVPFDSCRLSEPARSCMSQAGLQLSMLFPIRSVGPAFGFVAIRRRSPWVEAELQLCRAVAYMLCSAWERERQFEARLSAEARQAEALQVTERASHMAAIGVMAAGITHEINQPLSSMLFAVDRLESSAGAENGGPPARLSEDIETISKGIRRIGTIIHHMRSYWAKPEKIEIRTVDLNACVQNALSMLHRQLSSHQASLELRLGDSPLAVRGNPVHLELIVTNLVVNALSAVDLSGREDKLIHIQTGRSDGWLYLSVEDNGVGLPGGSSGQIFDPFFSSKAPHEGMGLGLALVKRFVEEHEGSVEAAASRLGGAAFTIRLPLYNSKESGGTIQ